MSTTLLPSGPRRHFLTGNLPEFRLDPLAFLSCCAREFGEIVPFRLGWQPALLLNNPDYIEQVLVVHNRDFTKSRGLRANRLLLGNGLLTNDGESWLRQRRLMQPAFHRDRITAYGDIMASYGQRTLARWRDGEVVDIHQEMMRLALEIVGEALFGTDVGADAREVSEALQSLVGLFKDRTTLIAMLPSWLPTPDNRQMRAAVARLDRVVYRIIERRRSSGEERDDLLSILLRARYEDGSVMSDQRLRDEVMTLFLAGHETTAIALSWTLYLLAQYPEVEARLVAELEEVLGGRVPLAADQPKLKYTEAVVSEGMRLFPPAWVITRQAARDVEIGPVVVRRGTVVFVSQWVMHRDGRFFDEPERFDPERWLDDRSQETPKFAYFPFGGGPRHCIGYSFATMEATLVLAAVVQRFHLELLPGPRVVPRPAITLRPSHGIRMTLHRRGSSLKAAA